MLAKTRGKIEPGETVSLQDRDGKTRCQLTLLARTEDRMWIGRPAADSSADESESADHRSADRNFERCRQDTAAALHPRRQHGRRRRSRTIRRFMQKNLER